jgi:hypothetical protein
MIKAFVLFAFSACCLGPKLSAQDSITWNSDANSTNLTSNGGLMGGGFRFEIGVFVGSFVPTPGNLDQWLANWVSADGVFYDPITRRFSGSTVLITNSAPFTEGKQGYVLGFSGNTASGEWILFRAPTWNWLSATNAPPSFEEWFARDATPVVGTIHASGSPFLMKSAAVSNGVLVPTTFSQWQADQLTGEPLNGANQDPDQDGVVNLLEFVFGTPPRVAGTPVATPVTLVSGALQITIPRRLDRIATLVVEVSSNLSVWNSGSGFTNTIQNDANALVVRDLTVQSGANPRRFIRLRASVP